MTREEFKEHYREVPNINTRKEIEEFFLRQYKEDNSPEKFEYLKELKAEFIE